MTNNQTTSSQTEPQTQKQKPLPKIDLGQIISLVLKLAATSLVTLHQPLGCNEVKWNLKVYGVEIERTAKSCHLPSNQADLSNGNRLPGQKIHVIDLW